MHIEVTGLKSKTIMLAQRSMDNDVVILIIVVKAETSDIDFIVETMSSRVKETFADLGAAIEFYERI